MPIDASDIDAAADRIAPYVRSTPLWALPGDALGLRSRTGAFEVWLKLEQLQISGSFKARGMFNRMLSHALPPSGVIAASGGNAGIATAVAARELSVPAEIFVPQICSRAKRERLAALGATVVVSGEVYADALAACEQRQRESGALMTHAYDQVEVVAGAGTLAREIERQRGTPDTVLVSVGGGGLIAGILNAHQVFLIPALTPALYQLGIIFGAVALVPRMGIHGLAWGVVLGALAYLVIQIPTLIRLLYPLRPHLHSPAWSETTPGAGVHQAICLANRVSRLRDARLVLKMV